MRADPDVASQPDAPPKYRVGADRHRIDPGRPRPDHRRRVHAGRPGWRRIEHAEHMHQRGMRIRYDDAGGEAGGLRRERFGTEHDGGARPLKVGEIAGAGKKREVAGTGPNQCVEGLKELEEAGLVTVLRTVGKASVIDLSFDTITDSITVPLPERLRTVTETIMTKETPIKKVKETLSSPSVPTKKDNLVRKITDYYQELFMEEYDGAKPTWDGKIIKLVKADIARLGDERLGGLIQLFFEDPTLFVKKNGTGMGYNIFHSQIDCLLEKRARMERREA